MTISEDIFYLGVNDHDVELFEGQYPVPNGMSYNSYLIKDEKIAVLDTVDQHFTAEWLGRIRAVLDGRAPDYLVVHHMEPDHSAGIAAFLAAYPEATVVSSAKAFPMMEHFFRPDAIPHRLVVSEGDPLPLGRHTLTFVAAPMVHWPEVLVSYESAEKILFAADGFGKFGALDAEEPWDDEARRYFIGIVGKYGAPVQALLKKAAALDIAMICPLHGPVLREDLGHCLALYDAWSSYRPESSGVVIACAGVYGHTMAAAEALAEKLKAAGNTVAFYDLSRCDMSQAVADAFRYDRLVLASITYNGDVFPFMRDYLHRLTERNFSNRTVGIIENGSWAPMAAKVIRKALEPCKNLTFADPTVTLRSGPDEASALSLEALAKALSK